MNERVVSRSVVVGTTYFYLGALGCGCCRRTLTFEHPRSAAGQAQLRLGQPLCIALGQAPTLSGTQAKRVVAGSVGIVRATVPFHGEHDAQDSPPP